jgi:hypothetical protein
MLNSRPNDDKAANLKEEFTNAEQKTLRARHAAHAGTLSTGERRAAEALEVREE